MGGLGSGRRPYSVNSTTEDHRALDVRQLQREGVLTPGRWISWAWRRNGTTAASIQIRRNAGGLTLKYRQRRGGGDWRQVEYSVALDWTHCNYGGRRAWFLCPVPGCGRRVALLYMGGAGTFACRHCRRLGYACQRESAGDRAARRADKIRQRLGWRPGILNPIGGRPKGMHFATYLRLRLQYDAFADAALAGILESIRRESRHETESRGA